MKTRTLTSLFLACGKNHSSAPARYPRCLSLVNCWLALVLTAGALSLADAADDPQKRTLGRTTTNANYNWFTINNIFNWYRNNGNSSYNIATSNSGLEFPKGSGKTAVFEDGVLWGGFHKGRTNPKVGGSEYVYGLQAGSVLTYGGPTEAEAPVADDPTLLKYRVYNVRPDVTPTTVYAAVQSAMEAEAALISRYQKITPEELFARYQKDWNEWPASDVLGRLPAPYTDVDHDGKYDPTKDIPGQPAADQTLYYVANDLDSARTMGLFSSPPIGLEMHRTVWGYNKPGPLANMIFARTLLVNKSGAPLDSAFLMQWSDPDLGTAEDDLSGCDVGRNLGYVYNGKDIDSKYGTAVPAVGYNLLYGPMFYTGNPTDSAAFRDSFRRGYKNLRMTTFALILKIMDPPLGASGADVQVYHLMNGRTLTDLPYINPLTGDSTKFAFDGDPVTGNGWLDGTYGLFPSDRRIGLVTGPFTFADRDTQELLVATIVGQGSDRFSSISVLRWYSDFAQVMYNYLSQIPTPPPPPRVQTGVLDRSVTLSWPDTADGAEIETWNYKGYQFEGYNVYQFKNPSPDLSQAVRLATYDLVNSVTYIFDDVYDLETGVVIRRPIQWGRNSGIKRFFRTSRDSANELPLRYGIPYYFGVSAYAYKPLAFNPASLECTPRLLTVIPQWEEPGVRYAASEGDTLQVVHSGISGGHVLARVVDPTALLKAGAQYQVVFKRRGTEILWDMLRTSSGVTDTAAKDVRRQGDSDADALILDGIDWRVTGPARSFKFFLTVSNGAGPLNPPQEGAFAFNSSGFPTADGNIPDGVNDRPNGTIQQSGGVLINTKGWGIHTGMTSPSMSLGFSHFINRVTKNGALWEKINSYDWEIRFTSAGGRAFIPAKGRALSVPFELWNIGVATPNDPSDDYRLFPYILDVDGNGGFNLLTKAGTDSVDNGGCGPTHSISGGANDPFTDWFSWINPRDRTPGQSGYAAIRAQVDGGTHTPFDPVTTDSAAMVNMVLVGWNFGTVASGVYPMQTPQVGTVFRIVTTKTNDQGDVFTITLPPAQQSRELAVADVKKIGVFPNPYQGVYTNPADFGNRVVTFTHLPRRVIIRIYTLSGTLVRTLMKDDPTQFVRWDLTNERNWRVAAGMYLVYIEVPDLGVSTTLKLGVTSMY